MLTACYQTTQRIVSLCLCALLNSGLKKLPVLLIKSSSFVFCFACVCNTGKIIISIDFLFLQKNNIHFIIVLMLVTDVMPYMCFLTVDALWLLAYMYLYYCDSQFHVEGDESNCTAYTGYDTYWTVPHRLVENFVCGCISPLHWADNLIGVGNIKRSLETRKSMKRRRTQNSTTDEYVYFGYHCCCFWVYVWRLPCPVRHRTM